jgi:hypothetical protein
MNFARNMHRNSTSKLSFRSWVRKNIEAVVEHATLKHEGREFSEKLSKLLGV